MSTYDLLEHFEDIQDAKKAKQPNSFNEASDDYINKSLFKDKKLSKLWDKAEKSGFTSEELLTLKEEFDHHQEKIDQYFSILKDVETGPKDGAVSKCIMLLLSRSHLITFVVFRTHFTRETLSKHVIQRHTSEQRVLPRRNHSIN